MSKQTILRKAEQKRQMKEYQKMWFEEMEKLDALCCHVPQDPYSTERDYAYMAGQVAQQKGEPK